jgi:hypothetical protein
VARPHSCGHTRRHRSCRGVDRKSSVSWSPFPVDVGGRKQWAAQQAFEREKFAIQERRTLSATFLDALGYLTLHATDHPGEVDLVEDAFQDWKQQHIKLRQHNHREEFLKRSPALAQFGAVGYLITFIAGDRRFSEFKWARCVNGRRRPLRRRTPRSPN